MSSEWILILTIIVSSGQSHLPVATTIESVPGFTSKATCLEAGEKWGKATIKTAPPGTQMNATCVGRAGTPAEKPPAPAPKVRPQS